MRSAPASTSVIKMLNRSGPGIELPPVPLGKRQRKGLTLSTWHFAGHAMISFACVSAAAEPGGCAVG